MTYEKEVLGLRERLCSLARQADSSLVLRYALKPVPGSQLSPYRRFRRAIGRLLRRLRLKETRPPEQWETALQHGESPQGAPPVVVWGMGTKVDELRAACESMKRALASAGYAPVLITDVADFAFYSRLGWLVEFVPTWSKSYAERKLAYLAWRYRNAAAVPLSRTEGHTAGLEEFLRA